MASDNAPGRSSLAQGTPSSTDRQWTPIRRYGEILADFARLAPEATSVERLSQLACVQATRGVGVGQSKALRHRPETGDLLLVAGIGWSRGIVCNATLGTDLATPACSTFQTRQTVTLARSATVLTVHEAYQSSAQHSLLFQRPQPALACCPKSLGSLMRSRQASCQALSNHRHTQDHKRQAEPTISNQVHDL